MDKGFSRTAGPAGDTTAKQGPGQYQTQSHPYSQIRQPTNRGKESRSFPRLRPPIRYSPPVGSGMGTKSKIPPQGRRRWRCVHAPESGRNRRLMPTPGAWTGEERILLLPTNLIELKSKPYPITSRSPPFCQPTHEWLQGGAGGVWWGCQPHGCGWQAYRDVFTASPARRHPLRKSRAIGWHSYCF